MKIIEINVANASSVNLVIKATNALASTATRMTIISAVQAPTQNLDSKYGQPLFLKL